MLQPPTYKPSPYSPKLSCPTPEEVRRAIADYTPPKNQSETTLDRAVDKMLDEMEEACRLRPADLSLRLD